MGIASIFSESADFANLLAKDNTEKLFVSNVLHKGLIEVNEMGTEAAAATGLQVGVTSVYEGPVVEFNADHPFLYMLIGSDKSIIFTGDFVGSE